MSKDKYKRKRQRAKQHTERKMPQARMHDGEVISADQNPKTTETPDRKGYDEEETMMGFREFLKRPSITDWCITAFTCVLAVVAFYQFTVTGGQLDVMRIDQRAWLQFEAAPTKTGDANVTWQIVSGQPVTYPLRVVNTGKTPAKNIILKVFVDIIDANQEPPLDHVDATSGYPHSRITSAIVFPNSDFKETVFRPSDNSSPRLATDDEVKAVREGRAYLAVYGIITYDDVFRIHRWTRFCEWIATGGHFQASGCTRYNAVDKD
jgi:uncharacterized repeat protein (TIGR01451 family)